mgnify:CR=1 FL=1
MECSDEDVMALCKLIKEELGTDEQKRFQPDGYGCVALSVIDAIYSTGNHYSGVLNVVSRYRARRSSESGSCDEEKCEDTASDLVEAFDRWGGIEGFVEATANRWKTSSKKGAPYKAYAVYEAAKILKEHGLETPHDLKDKFSCRENREKSDVTHKWKAITGQRRDLTWHYFLMLVGIPGVKGDRMITSYVSRALGNRHVSPTEASRLVERAADELNLAYGRLDHAMWRKESRRDFIDDSAQKSMT